MIKTVALNFFVFIFYSFQDGNSSCTDGWPGAHRGPPTSASQVRG